MKNISSKEPDIIEYIPGKYAEEKLWQKESLYRSLFNEMLSAFILFEIIYDNEGKPRDYRFLDVNPAFEKMTGLCISQVQEKNFIEVFSDVDPSWYENFYRVVSTEKPVHFEGYSHKLKKYADVIAYMPQKGQLAIMLTDITERKTMEVALRQSEEKYRILSEASQDIIYVINKDDYVEYVNSFAAKQFKCSPEELIGKPRSSLFPPELASQQKYFLEKVFKTGQVVQSESKQQFLEHVCWQNTRLVPLKDETGEVRAVMGVSRDITETKRVDEALRVSEERLKFALEGTNDGVWDWNILTGEAYFSPRYYTMLGYEPYEFQPSYESWKSLVHPDDIEIMEHVDFKKDNYTLEFRMREKTGEWYWIKSRGKVVEWDEYGKPIRMVGTHTDITDQKEAENKLRLSEEKFFKAFSISPDAMAISSIPDGTYLEVNEVFLNLLGYTAEEVIGKTSKTLNIWVNSEDEGKLFSMIQKSGKVTDLELSFRRKDSKEVIVLMSASYLDVRGERCLLGIAKDITERKKLEEQLFQSQKMEAIGQLAGGIAHDFNNLLTGILGYSTILTMESEEGSIIYDAATTIEKAALRATELTKQLLGFSRRGKFIIKTVNLNDVVSEVVSLLSRTIHKNINIIERFTVEKSLITGDPGQIQQVVLNLAVNARDSMPEGGVLTIETREVYLDQEYIRFLVDIKPGYYIMLSVIDTGCGIPKETLEHIFEPFFTTKEKDKGTGMGLAMVYGIVKNHGGAIHVYSEVGYGTVFHVYFPVSEEHILKDSADTRKPLSGTGRILVVDDEEVVLDISSRLLTQLGYEVITVKGGKHALEYYQNYWQEIDLVIIDMIMPEMSGHDCFKALKRINPEINALMSTGYGVNGKSLEFLEEGCSFIQKPYNINDLSASIINALKRDYKSGKEI